MARPAKSDARNCRLLIALISVLLAALMGMTGRPTGVLADAGHAAAAWPLPNSRPALFGPKAITVTAKGELQGLSLDSLRCTHATLTADGVPIDGEVEAAAEGGLIPKRTCKVTFHNVSVNTSGTIAIEADSVGFVITKVSGSKDIKIGNAWWGLFKSEDKGKVPLRDVNSSEPNDPGEDGFRIEFCDFIPSLPWCKKKTGDGAPPPQGRQDVPLPPNGPDEPRAPAPQTCEHKPIGDANCDGAVNAMDYALALQESLGVRKSRDADFNGDGKVDDADLKIVQENLGTGVGKDTGQAACDTKPLGDADCNGTVNAADVAIAMQESAGLTKKITADFNGDGKVDQADIDIATANLGTGVGKDTSQPACDLKSSGDADCNGAVNATDLAIAIQERAGLSNKITADFNGDGKVDDTDIEIARRNLGAGGG